MIEKTETVNFPVVQSINPWTFNFAFNGIVPASVAMGSSRDARLEQIILDAAGSYGRQLGRLGEAVAALIARIDRLHPDNEFPPTEEEAAAIDAFRDQMRLIEDIKKLNARRPE